jgi:hypothetical protein
MVVKPEIFAWQKTGSFYVALTFFCFGFDSSPTNLYSILSNEGEEWQHTVPNAKQRILKLLAFVQIAVLN